MARGGKRNPTQGRSYGNRTDLLGKTPTPKIYGEGVEMQERLDAVPITPAPGPPQPQMAAPMPVPPGAFDRPTERPMEPLTAGLDIGPGPGSEALGMPAGDPDAEQLRAYLPALERLASLPTSTSATRNLVRRLRGAAR